MNLTHYQKTVAAHNHSHALCIAVAGSGKTSTLAHLINQLLNSSADARRMMVMMFNKSAQLDFTKKVRQVASEHPQLPEVRTYHSTGLRLLRTLEGWHLREPYNKSPLSDKVIELKIKELLQRNAPESMRERLRSDTARYIESSITFIDGIKSNLTTANDWFEETNLPEEYRFYVNIFQQFEQWRHSQKAITFIDMLYDPMSLVIAHPECIPQIENKMDYIIVDEYQDTSTLQHEFTRLIAGERAKVIAVGDPDQTIYEFAGANINNILHHFQHDFGSTNDVVEMSLPHTFRYGHSIALAASHLISTNKARKDVLCIAHDSNASSEVITTRSEGNDTEQVISALRHYLDTGVSPESIAILVRVWAQAVLLELSMLQQGIPYTSDGPSLFQRPEIETLLCALKMSAGLFALLEPDNRAQQLTKMLTLPHIGLKTHSVQQLVTQLQFLERGYGDKLDELCLHIRDISQYQMDKLRSRARVFQYLERIGQNNTPTQILRTYIQDTELVDSLHSMSLNEQRTEEQILSIKGFQSFLKELSDDTRECCFHIDDLIERHRQRRTAKKAGANHHVVTLSSSHKAKGLEWPVVLIPGLTRQYWPFTRDDDLAALSSNTLETERRLLYVAMTRSRKILHLFTCKESGNHWASDKNKVVSPFFEEMNLAHCLPLAETLHNKDPEKLIQYLKHNGITRISERYLKTSKPELEAHIKQADRWNKTQTLNSSSKRTPKSHQRLRTDLTDDAPWQIKRRVRHAIFGEGRVTQVNDANFVIQFDRREFGAKRFAKHEEVKHLFELI
ncbi:hypothetical protein ACH42_04925 [Endozoicomonas sp. (ex Bugula neritina AB1)]|nr:hypothetical protein ACH42_04925 [Endozoicomonas sp. (ex Bugula neritina AB1)]